MSGSPILDAVRAVARPGGRILHAGGSSGPFITAMLADGHDTYGVNTSVDTPDNPLRARAAALPSRLFVALSTHLPFADRAFATVVVSPGWLDPNDAEALATALGELIRVSRDAIVVELTAPADANDERLTREWWESRLFAAGLRRHTRFFAVGDFESLEDETAGTCLIMQRIPDDALAAHPLDSLRGERDLHMDMLRETGRRSDAHLARYEWARSWVKPGDVVVDAACGLGYGSAMLWDGSEAARVIGLDISDRAIGYARDSFLPGRSGLEFRVADAEAWDGWLDNSIDCIVSFETIEHLPNPARFVTGAQRVLKPGGRFLCSVPNQWVDASGQDPNPFHLHVFDLDRLVKTVTPAFIVDEAYAQSAGGHGSRFAPRRLLRNIGWPQQDSAQREGAEWWLLSVIKDPLDGADVLYEEQVFPATSESVPNPIAFGRDYVNPWAVHALVMGPFRVRSPRLLHELASRWFDISPKDSPDAGAALCILTYRALDQQGLDLTPLLPHIAGYRLLTTTNAHVRRWQISLSFAQGLWHMRRGDFNRAEECFRSCAGTDASAFSPHLETKTTEAAWLAGRLALERGDISSAAAAWTGAFDALERVKTASIADWLVTPNRPAAFEFGDGLREIAMTIDSAALSANALHALGNPAGEWRPAARSVDRNFQRNAASLLTVVHSRGGSILALRAELHAAHESWRVSRETLYQAERDLERVCAEAQVARETVHAAQEEARELGVRLDAERAAGFRTKAERAALAGALRRLMPRVVILGAGDEGRRVWEALARRGTAHIVGFVDADPRRHERQFLGSIVHDPEWLNDRKFDVVAVTGSHSELRELLVRLNIPNDCIIAFPTSQDDAALDRVAAEWFPDPLAATLSARQHSTGARVGIFGTGAAAMKVWEALAEIDSATAVWFADNNPAQQGRSFLWVDVIAPGLIPATSCDAVVIGSMSRDPIRKQLLGLGIPAHRILTPNVTAPVAALQAELSLALAALEEVRQ